MSKVRKIEDRIAFVRKRLDEDTRVKEYVEKYCRTYGRTIEQACRDRLVYEAAVLYSETPVGEPALSTSEVKIDCGC